MFREEIQKLTERLEFIENRFEDFETEDIGSDEYNELEEEVYEIEREISEYIGVSRDSQASQLQRLQKKVTQIKRDNDFYDQEAELDMMFPNRHDDDFDEDSMSYDSVFGGD